MIDLGKTGWLNEYIQYKKKDYERGAYAGLKRKRQHPDQAMYSIIQPTGIMYGYPVKALNSTELVDSDSHAKLLLMDTMLSSYFLTLENEGESHVDYETTALEGVNMIADFYNTIYKNLYTSRTNFFGRKRADFDVLEMILDKRINIKGTRTFWSVFFHRSLMFLDVYFFRQWVQTQRDKMVSEFLKTYKDDIRNDIVKVMAAAAHANEIIEPEERQLFELFISSQNFTAQKRKEAIGYFEQGISVEDIPIPDEQSWLLKKYLLELAILTTWADKKIQDLEMDFLVNFNRRLGFVEEELENSLIAIEGFVLEHWEYLEELLNRQDFEQVKHEYISRLEAVVNRNKPSLIKEIREHGDLPKILEKARREELSLEEQDRIRQELVDCLQSIPSFEIITLPKKFLSLKVLMEILPNNIFKEV
ncbi:MAG: TerB family tellurite resistance protein [Cyclobacteriaceae bacterium]|nr:TerB family tellurite resistance protein [Cyclobacteriaceae bacterium]